MMPCTDEEAEEAEEAEEDAEDAVYIMGGGEATRPVEGDAVPV
jgi:hypothetical protein